MKFFLIGDPDLIDYKVADRSLIAAMEQNAVRKGRVTITGDGLKTPMCRKCKVGLSRERVQPVCLELEPPLPYDFGVEVPRYFLAADWVSRVFEEEQISGLVRSRAYVHDDNETEIPEPEGSPGGVFCFDVVGKGGKINADESVYVTPEGEEVTRSYRLCPKCGSMSFDTKQMGLCYKHLVFHVSEWDGSDCCEVGFLGTVVTERFLEILKSHGIKNWAAMEVYAK